MILKRKWQGKPPVGPVEGLASLKRKKITYPKKSQGTRSRDRSAKPLIGAVNEDDILRLEKIKQAVFFDDKAIRQMHEKLRF